jgi:phosphate transport system substrate-binding protein
MGRNWLVFPLVCAATVALVGCPAPGRKVNVVSVDGSSTVYPVSAALAEMYQDKNPGTKVEVRFSGTGGGFKKFVRDELDISDASRPISKGEIEEARKNGVEFIELPVCFDALTVVIHPSNTWAEKMTVEQLKMVWSPESEEKKVTKWSQIDKGWPEEQFKLFGAGTDSGTFDYFTEAINGKSGRSRKDFTPSEDDNVLVTGVAGNPNALGYFGYAYYETNKGKVKAVAVQDKGKKEFVLPSQESILDGSYTPLSRPLFIYVNKKSLAAKPEVKRFIEFYLANIAEACKTVKYVPLPEKAYEVVRKRFADGKAGTAFGGEPAVGLPIDDVLKREPK